jgi:hypothetical protein
LSDLEQSNTLLFVSAIMFQLMGAYSKRPSASGPQEGVEDSVQLQEPKTGQEEEQIKKKKKKKNQGEACLELVIAKPEKVDGAGSNDSFAADKEGVSPNLKMV